MTQPSIWQTDRVRLRAIEPGDWQAFWSWNQDDETTRNLDWIWFPQSREAVKQWAEEMSRRKPENDNFHWVIESREGVAVGSISTHDCNRRCGTFSYGVNIGAEHRRHGYAADAIQVVIRYYFAELGYQKVTISVVDFNDASIQLHERLGFLREGRLRRLVFTHGQYCDLLMYGQTRDEFAQRIVTEKM